jgi:cell division inhibitor SepF
MGAFSKIKGSFMGLADIIMPINDDFMEYEDEIEEKAAETKKQSRAVNRTRTAASTTAEYKVSNGASVHVARPSYGSSEGFRREKTHAKKQQPQLKVHTTKMPQLKMQIFAPRNFEQVTGIADDLKAGKACVVNYEQIESAEQRRICDFVNGVCYVLDGSARRVSNKIMLYVPAGVDVSEAMTLALTD